MSTILSAILLASYYHELATVVPTMESATSYKWKKSPQMLIANEITLIGFPNGYVKTFPNGPGFEVERWLLKDWKRLYAVLEMQEMGFVSWSDGTFISLFHGFQLTASHRTKRISYGFGRI